MAKDLRASQLQTTQIISSGSSSTNARIVMYDVDAQSTASPNQGVIDTGKFALDGIGEDIFLFVSGGINEKDIATGRISVFGGDLHVSGNLTVDGAGAADVDWVDGGGQLRTTSSVSISSIAEFAPSQGSDVYFYVSGGTRSGASRTDVALFNGDVVSSSSFLGPDGILSRPTYGFAGRLGSGMWFNSTRLMINGVSIRALSMDNSDVRAHLDFLPNTTDTLDLGGTTNLWARGFFSSGSTALPSVAFGSLGTTGLSQPSPDQLAVSTNGAEIQRWAEQAPTASTGLHTFSTMTFDGTALNGANDSWRGLSLIGSVEGSETSDGYSLLYGNIITDGAAGTRRMIDMQVDGVALFSVERFGTVSTTGKYLAGDGSLGTPAYAFSGSVGSGSFLDGNDLTFVDGNNPGGLTLTELAAGGGGASGLWTADGTGTEIRVTSSVAVSTVSEFASAKGTDVFFYASGTIGAKDSSVRAVGLFGGDLHISGNLTVDGTSPGGSSQANQLQVGIVDYATTSTTSSTTVGQITFTGSEYSGSIYLSALVSATAAAVSSSIRLYNLDDFAYVAIGGGSQEHLGAASTTPTKLTSVDLKSAANFNAISSSNYELQVSSSSESTIVTIGASAFLVTGVVSLASEHLSLGSYTLSTATSSNPQVVGGGYLVPSEHSLNSVIFRSILSTTTGSDAAIVQLYNLTSGALVHIGGASSTQISTSSITPANVQSVELTTATNFDLTTPSVYEVRVFGSGSASPITVIHNSEFVFT